MIINIDNINYFIINYYSRGFPHLHKLTYTYIYLCILTYTYVYLYILMYTYVYLHIWGIPHSSGVLLTLFINH